MSKEKPDAVNFCREYSHVLQKIPYHQCGIALRNEDKDGQVEVKKFTSLKESDWQVNYDSISQEIYMNRNILSVPLEEDCFTKLDQSFKEDPNKIASKMGIIHSRFASNKSTIKNNLAHPNFDNLNRVAVFHNGFIANFDDLQK